MGLDVDKCIATLKKGEVVSEQDLRQLCQYVGELLMEESNVQPIVSTTQRLLAIYIDIHLTINIIGTQIYKNLKPSSIIPIIPYLYGTDLKLQV